MALSNAEKQKRYRQRRHDRRDRQINMMLDEDAYGYVGTLAKHWQCKKREVIERALRETWAKYESEIDYTKIEKPASHPDQIDLIAALGDKTEDRVSKRHLEPVNEVLLKRLSKLTPGLTKGFRAEVLKVMSAKCRRVKGGFEVIDTNTGKKWGVGATAAVAWRNAQGELLHYRNKHSK